MKIITKNLSCEIEIESEEEKVEEKKPAILGADGFAAEKDTPKIITK